MRITLFFLLLLTSLLDAWCAAIPTDALHITGMGEGPDARMIAGYVDLSGAADPAQCHLALQKSGGESIARWFPDLSTDKIRFEFTVSKAAFETLKLVLSDLPLSVKKVEEIHGSIHLSVPVKYLYFTPEPKT